MDVVDFKLLYINTRNYYCRITDSVGPTETSIAPRQRPKAANANVVSIHNTVTPVKMTVPTGPVSNGQKGKRYFGIAVPSYMNIKDLILVSFHFGYL